MPKILLIEDEKILADMYRDKFSEEKIDVVSAFDADQGLAMAKKERPDLIILDIILPERDGISFLKDLRAIKNKKISSIPVVILSNYDNPQAKKETQKFGVMDYLIKTDFTPVALSNRIKKYLPR